jgi:hypothetical protein
MASNRACSAIVIEKGGKNGSPHGTRRRRRSAGHHRRALLRVRAGLAEPPTAPKNLPPAVAQKLNNEARKMLKEPKVRDYFTQQALLSLDLDVPGTQSFVGREVARWGALAKSVGLTVQ